MIKLLTDFDGIWTNQEEEAEYVWNYIVKKLAEISGFGHEEISNFLDQVKREMNKTPWLYGWMNNGKTACYYGEDPFGDNNAIFDFIGRRNGNTVDDSLSNRINIIAKSILKAGYPSLDKFSNDCFFESTGQFKAEGKLNACKEAKEVVEKILPQNIEVVIASNSKTDKIEYLFSKIGLTPTNESSPVRGRLHTRGNSMKFVIDNEYVSLPEYYTINSSYKVPLRRKHYHEVLIDEKPDYVLGDVFSLDVALPLYLRLNDTGFKNLKVIQKVQPHTPAWVKDFLSMKEFEGIAFMAESISDVYPVLFKNK
jgi:phosphoglycolate phosphatase-like HAD superfamily hydrolase